MTNVVSLVARGRRVTIPEHFLAEARLAIEAAITGPHGKRLSSAGFDDPYGHVRGRELSVGCVATVLAFISCGPVKRTRTVVRASACHSYYLKHVAERWGEALCFEPYVANGDLICAALYRGIPIKRLLNGGPNCWLALRELQR